MIKKDTKSAAWADLVRLPSEITIEAGIFQEEGSQPKKSRKNRKTKLSLVEIAACHEFGSLIKNAAGAVLGEIPQRSFLRAWFDANEERIQAYFVRRLAIEGPENVDRAMNQLALWIEGEIRRNIRRRIPPPLATETIRRKGSTVPLIDTGQLINAILAKVDGKIPT